MYGTIFRMIPRPGKEEEVRSLFEEWGKTRSGTVPGALAGYLMRPENRQGELVGVAVFRDRKSYFDNAASPEQDAWFRRLRALLENDPIWEDGDYLWSTYAGGR